MAVSQFQERKITELHSRGDRSCQGSLEERTRKDAKIQNAHL